MKKYVVRLTAQAEEDFEKIINYLSELSGPIVAERYYKNFMKAFSKLRNIGAGMRILDDIIPDVKGMRRVHMKRYMIFYDIDEENDLIRVLRIIHGSSDWWDFSKWLGED